MIIIENENYEGECFRVVEPVVNHHGIHLTKQFVHDGHHDDLSMIHDFQFFVQPKYKIAKDQPGSGNTKNIGGITNIQKLVNGKGPFSELGEPIFDDFWMYYLTKDMAKALEIPRPYTNLKSYMEYKKNGIDMLEAKEDLIRSFEDDDISNEDEE